MKDVKGISCSESISPKAPKLLCDSNPGGLSSIKMFLDVQNFENTVCQLTHPANHPAGRLHRTNTSHLCLGALFLALLPRTPPLAIPGSPFGFPNSRPSNVRFDLLTTVWSCSSSPLLLQDPPLAFMSCLFLSTHLNDDDTFHSSCSFLGILFLFLLCRLFLPCWPSAPSTSCQFGPEYSTYHLSKLPLLVDEIFIHQLRLQHLEHPSKRCPWQEMRRLPWRQV